MNLFEPGPSAYERDLMGLLDQLSPDEIEELQTYFAHKTNNGHALSDDEVAMNDFLHQVRELNRINEDMALARRIAAGEDDGTAPPSPTRSPRNNHQRRGATVQVLSPVIVNRPTGHDCVACQDPIHGAEILAPCGDYYDVGCMTGLFQSATRDESIFPPRCCGQNIPFARAQPHLPQALVTVFQQKEVEYSTLKRVYCFSPKCSRFLGPLVEDINVGSSKVYVCPEPECRRRTCGKCRQQHLGSLNHVCRPDADATQILELGRNSGWARCPGCSHMVELMLGCFHMTCRCRTEFCYLCRALWKTCQCPQAEEQYLVQGNHDVEAHHEDVDIFNDHESDGDEDVEEQDDWQERELEESEEEQEVGGAEEREEWQEREPEEREEWQEREPEEREEWQEREPEVREEWQEREPEEREEWQEREPEVREFDVAEVREDLTDWNERVEQLDEHGEQVDEEELDTDGGNEEGMRELREEQEAQELIQWEERGVDDDEPSELQESQEPQQWRWAEEEESEANEVNGEEPDDVQHLHWGPEEYDADDAEEEGCDADDTEEGYHTDDTEEYEYDAEEEECDADDTEEDGDEEPEVWEGQEPDVEQWEGDDNDAYDYDSDAGW